jgi:hypothetical protein
MEDEYQMNVTVGTNLDFARKDHAHKSRRDDPCLTAQHSKKMS